MLAFLWKLSQDFVEMTEETEKQSVSFSRIKKCLKISYMYLIFFGLPNPFAFMLIEVKQ